MGHTPTLKAGPFSLRYLDQRIRNLDPTYPESSLEESVKRDLAAHDELVAALLLAEQLALATNSPFLEAFRAALTKVQPQAKAAA